MTNDLTDTLKLPILSIEPPKPVCYLMWGTQKGCEYGTSFAIFRDFNWFQKKMLKWCFGLDYKKASEDD